MASSADAKDTEAMSVPPNELEMKQAFVKANSTAEFHTVEGSEDDYFISQQQCGSCEATFAIAMEPKFCPNCGARNVRLP